MVGLHAIFVAERWNRKGRNRREVKEEKGLCGLGVFAVRKVESTEMVRTQADSECEAKRDSAQPVHPRPLRPGPRLWAIALPAAR